MGNLVYVAIAVGLSTLGAVTLWAVRHRPRSMQHQMDAFSRELRALQSSDTRAQGADAHLDRVEPMPIRPRAVEAGRPNPAPPNPPNTPNSLRSPGGDAAEQPNDRRRSVTES